MKIDCEWCLEKVREGYTPEEIEEMAQNIRINQEYDLLQQLVRATRNSPLWHNTELLSDEQVIKAFTQAGEEIVAKGYHKRENRYRGSAWDANSSF